MCGGTGCSPDVRRGSSDSSSRAKGLWTLDRDDSGVEGEDVETMSKASLVTGALEKAGHAVRGQPDDYDELIEMARDRRVVLIGEASHGTHEFYYERARITRRLIEECGFTAVAVEADWPDAYRVNRYVMGLSKDPTARVALTDFKRFPTWMWRNVDTMQFLDWLRAHNDHVRAAGAKARFLGLDLYSLRASIAAVVAYLDIVDPKEAERARQRYSCFDHVGADGQAYGFALAYREAIPCEREVVAQLIRLREDSERYLRRDGYLAEDEQFCAEQNASVVRDAEEYYQQMFRAEVSSWNLRDRHMASTLEAAIAHLDGQVGAAKVVVWEHNSHIGDARATGMAARGELNVGELVRERFSAAQCLLIGMTTFDGTVTAATDWGEPGRRRNVRPALPESHEALLHEVRLPAFWLSTSEHSVRPILTQTRLERAIGVIYRPETERQSHYFPARLADQFDVVIHIDRTRALEPLERSEHWDRSEPPETYPTGY
jgi:erythromycin esterase-like protein